MTIKMNNRPLKVLEVGNIYFPVKDKNKQFTIISTEDIRLDTSKSIELLKLKKVNSTFFNFQVIKELWTEISKEPRYLTYDWIVPIYMYDYDNVIYFTIDCLEEVKKSVAMDIVLNIEDYLLSEGHDSRMEELILNLEYQIIDNPQWIEEFK